MDRMVITIEKFADYKKALKSFIKGLIKSKIFMDENAKLNIVVEKEDKFVTVSAFENGFYAEFACESTIRVVNKLNKESVEDILKQFNKLKNFGGISVKIES